MIPTRIKKEALAIIGGIYGRFNASWSTCYAFTHDGKEITSGEYRTPSEEYPPPANKFDGYVDFNRNDGTYKFHNLNLKGKNNGTISQAL